MAFSKEQEKALKEAGYKKSAYDNDKYLRGNDTVKSRSNTTIFNDNTRNTGISNSLFGKKIK